MSSIVVEADNPPTNSFFVLVTICHNNNNKIFNNNNNNNNYNNNNHNNSNNCLAPLFLCELCCPLLSAMSSRSLRSSQQGLLLVPFARTSTKQSRIFFLWWVPRSEMGSFLNFGFCLEPCHLRFFLTLRLLFLAVLESGVPLSSFLEEALYKCSI